MDQEAFEALARRVATLEEQMRTLSAPKDWRAMIGGYADTEFSRAVDAAGAAIRERERQEAREEAAREAAGLEADAA